MTDNVNAEIISIGTEILLGELTDTNSVHIARELRDIGVNIYFMTSVGDNRGRIADAIRIALERADVVITCGGLGPTVDDMTRQSVADATNRDLVFHQVLLDQIAERFRSFKVTMTENNKRQAYLPSDAIVIENPVGTAPSFIVEQEGKSVISLPGVPREMKFLMAERVIPYLKQRYGLGVIKARILHAAGIGESSLDDLLGPELLEQSNPTIGLAAHNGQIDIRITAKADTVESANKMIASVEDQVRQRVGQHIYGVDGEKLQDVLLKTLEKSHQKLIIVEVGIRLSILDGADIQCVDRFSFESVDELTAQFSLEPSEKLSDLILQAAEKIFTKKSEPSVIIVVVSSPDVDEGADVSEGTAIIVKTANRTRSRNYGFGAKSPLARQWVSTWAMSAAWWMIEGSGEW